ncbi:MAG: hypothetical protein IKG56_05030 [Clostridia bacterium]|nr:hypothetical protein [Clostridia bacterium]
MAIKPIIGDLELLNLAFSEFVSVNHRSDYMSTRQCQFMMDTVGDIPTLVLSGVNEMKTGFDELDSFWYDGDFLIYKDNPDLVILVVFD